MPPIEPPTDLVDPFGRLVKDLRICDRVRLTADGRFRSCLFATDEIARRIERAVGTKLAGHQIDQVGFVRPVRTMSQIGG